MKYKIEFYSQNLGERHLMMERPGLNSWDEAKSALMQHWQSVKKSDWEMGMLLTHRFTARAAGDGSLWEVKIVRDTDLEDYLEGFNDEDPGS